MYEVKEVGHYVLIVPLERCVGCVCDGLDNSLVIDEGLVGVEGRGLFDDMMEHLSWFGIVELR